MCNAKVASEDHSLRGDKRMDLIRTLSISKHRANQRYFSFVIIRFRKFQGHSVFDIINVVSVSRRDGMSKLFVISITVKMKSKLLWICIGCMSMIKNGPNTEP